MFDADDAINGGGIFFTGKSTCGSVSPSPAYAGKSLEPKRRRDDDRSAVQQSSIKDGEDSSPFGRQL